MLLYFFLINNDNNKKKNVALVSCQLYYAGSNAFSVQSLFHPIFTIFFNIFFTAFPIIVFGNLNSLFSYKINIFLFF
jgi:hypothetical protein